MKRLPNICLLCLIATFIGCGGKIEVYEVPKDSAAAETSSTAQSSAGMPSAPPALPQIKWDSLPESWKVTEGGPMRVASFRIDADGGSAEMAALPLPSNAGMTEADLVGMWREQLNLSVPKGDEINKLVTPITIGGAPGKLFDITEGKAVEDRMFLVAMVVKDEWMWFFRLTGSAAVVSSQSEIYKEFLKGLTFEAPAPVSMPQTSSSPSSSGRPEWKTPDHWVDLGAGMMQVAKYRADGDGGTTEVSVSQLGGGAGGIPMNVNRWRGQLGLGSVSDTDANALAKSYEVPTGSAKVVDLVGDSKSMLVIMVSQGGSTWFFKSMGTKAAVERERAGFVEFVKSVQYN